MLSAQYLCFRIQCRFCCIGFFGCCGFDSYLALREWNLDVVLVECIVDAFHNLAVVHILCEYIHPDQNLECDATVVEAFQHYLDAFLMIDTVELVQGIGENLLHMLHIGAISHANL